MNTEQRSQVAPKMIAAVFAACGIWLALSPYILGFSDHTGAWWNAVIIGLALVVLGLLGVSSRERLEGLRWTALILGAWLVASPFVAEYGYLTAATYNAIALGVVVVLAAIVAVAAPAPRPVM